MGCTTSVQVAKHSQGMLKLQQDLQTFCADQLMIQEVLFLKTQLLEVHLALGLFRKDKHQKLQYVKVSTQVLKKLYFTCNSNSNTNKQSPNKRQSIQQENSAFQDEQQKQSPKSNSFPNKYFQNLSFFLGNGIGDSFVSFAQFVKMYSILTKLSTKSQQYIQVLFSFLSKGMPFLTQSQLKQFFSAIQLSIQQFQRLYTNCPQVSSPIKRQSTHSSESSIFILPTIINKKLFQDYFKTIQKSQPESKRLTRFQQGFSLLKNKRAIFRDYYQLKQLLIDQEINQIKNYGQQVFVVSRKWYEFFVSLFHKVFDTKIVKSDRNQKKSYFLRISTNKSPRKSDRKSCTSTKNVQINQTNPYVMLNNQIMNDKQIEGEYRLQLKSVINQQITFKVLSEKLYRFIESFVTHGSLKFESSLKSERQTKISSIQYRRKVLSSQKVQYYPLLVFLLKTNKKGKVDQQNVEEILLSQTTNLKQLKSKFDQVNQAQNTSFFVKIFEQKNFREQTNHSVKIKQLGTKSSNLIIVITSNRIGFIEQSTRKQIKKENLTIGDKIYAFSQKNQAILPGYIIAKNEKSDQLRVHFIDKSWREQVTVNIQSIYLKKDEVQNQKQRPKNYVQQFTGMMNVGNTCYINSSIQSLLSTTVFSHLLNLQPINTRLFSYQMEILFNYLQSPSPHTINQTSVQRRIMQLEFKQKTVEFFKQFQHWQQQDTQQFIHAILDKISEEQKHFIEKIFKFWIENQLVCQSNNCDGRKVNKQAMTMVTLPIPEPKQIYVEILMVPIYREKIQKIFIKLHHSATLGQLLRRFEQRSNLQSHKFIMVETDNGVIKQVRTELTQTIKDHDLITLQQLGIVANYHLTAYEMIKDQKIFDLVKRNNRGIQKKQYYDFFIKQTKRWTITKIFKLNADPVIVQYLNKDRQFVQTRIPRAQIDNSSYSIQNLGVRTLFNEHVHVKLFMRKLIPSPINQGKIMEVFGFPFIITLPIWCNYNDALTIIYEQLQNVITNAQNNEDYTIRFLEQKRQKCIFCQTQVSRNFMQSQDMLKKCCKVLEADAPILFLSKVKYFAIYLDWKNLKCYNSTFGSALTMDRACRATQESYKEQKVSLYECFNLLRIKQEVQMTCQKCNHKKMYRQESISTLPPILIIQLKEYRFIYQKQTMVKLNTNLNYDQVKKIDIDPYLAPNSIVKDSLNYSSIYELYSVIHHVGSGNSGHYTAICKRKLRNGSDDEVWVFFDDKFSKIVDENEVQNYMNNAYMLFYRKQYLSVDARLKLNLI